MWWARCAIGMQTGQLALSLNDLCICIEDLCEFAMQTNADVGGLIGEFVHQALCGPHNELEMRDVITFVGADHQKFILLRRTSVQPIASVKHEYLKRSHPMFRD